ncbi:heptaprenyl diphosphate synthase component 1 [Paenibacillus sp. HN-1]|uniref:heptaprenyl diphosphate synthase component 1 n=1 Tax=Paenibacillus TaxID=44249 RepID=UPI001CA7C779|nr:MULTISPECIES: heptaprenyl diphosphate synthase component 1 [Paenibacillus]MBY9081646.1 heptaprenyl diphosphate synthase component 1 [Paenibacillus sp. CGMCC 1.18879]MBY9083515.1 heptaprenyl diphosphate synthase component 1 [Paenibacillus sinensis]
MKPYRIPQLAKSYTDYDMIRRHTELPPLSDARGALLYTFLNHASRRQPEAELYALVTALVQLALDTHESVDEAKSRDEAVMRSRQLKVLAGDFFSSWFYRLLAGSGEIGMIGTLSTAIANFNVLKAQMYIKAREMMFTAEAYLQTALQLNMSLFQSFTPLIDQKLVEPWRSLLKEFTQCETVALELKRGELPEQGQEGFSYWHLLESGTEEERRQLRERKLENKDWKKLKMKYKCDSLLTDKLHQAIDAIHGVLQELKDEALIRELRATLEGFLLHHKISGQAAGEA